MSCSTCLSWLKSSTTYSIHLRTTVKKGKTFEILFFVQENIDEIEERKKLSETIKFLKNSDKWFKN